MEGKNGSQTNHRSDSWSKDDSDRISRQDERLLEPRLICQGNRRDSHARKEDRDCLSPGELVQKAPENRFLVRLGRLMRLNPSEREMLRLTPKMTIANDCWKGARAEQLIANKSVR